MLERNQVESKERERGIAVVLAYKYLHEELLAEFDPRESGVEPGRILNQRPVTPLEQV